METAAGKFGLELNNDRVNTSVEWATSVKCKIMNTMFQKKAGRRWTWKSSNRVKKAEIDFILINRPGIVTDVTVINQVNIASDHRTAMSNVKLGIEVEREKLITKRPPRVEVAQMGSKKIEFQLEPINRFETLQELDDIDTMSEAITDVIQQRASRVT